MSHPVNTEILENLLEKWEIISCSNGVGQFELAYENESTHETFDTLQEAKKAIQVYVSNQLEEMPQP